MDDEVLLDDLDDGPRGAQTGFLIFNVVLLTVNTLLIKEY